MDTEALPAAFHYYPQVLRALEELKMLAQTDAEREQYEARRKAQLDYNTGLKAARLEGRQEGRQEGRLEGRHEGRQEGRLEGEKIGIINLCEKLLNRQPTPAEHLAGLSLEELTRLAEVLQAELAEPR